MKAALIPPISGLDRFGNGNFHLLLSHLLKNRRYFRHYERQRRKGAYLVLDNSAHEFGAGDDPEVLMFNAVAIGAQEVVVPDVLENGPATVQMAVDSLETWFEQKYNIKTLFPALMYVPQGKDFAEWEDCLKELVGLHLYLVRKQSYHRHLVIGLSKDYEVWPGGLFRLVEHLYNVRETLDRADIKMHVHMLGWGRDLWALEKIAKIHQWIRSTDSAKPFVYGLRKITLDPDQAPPKYPTRPENYFNRRITEAQEEICMKNAVLYRAIASGSRKNKVRL